MSESSDFVAYPTSQSAIWWIRDGKARRDMTPEELAEQHRKDRETYRRMRERMAVDPEYREARLSVSRGTTRRYHERNADNEEQRKRRRGRDRERYARLASELGAKRRAEYVGAKAERIRAANRTWYMANRERRREYNRNYRQQNGERIRARERERQRLEYVNDPKKFNDYQKQWRARNPDKSHLYVRVSAQQRRAAAQGTSFTRSGWLAVVEAYQGRCAYCGAEGPLESNIEYR